LSDEEKKEDSRVEDELLRESGVAKEETRQQETIDEE
jgi:hypothetical protein